MIRKSRMNLLTIYVHWGVNRFEWRATLHMTSIKSFVSVLHIVNHKNTVEHVSVGTASANSLPYRSSLLCLERKCVTNVETVLFTHKGTAFLRLWRRTTFYAEKQTHLMARCLETLSLSPCVSNTCPSNICYYFVFSRWTFTCVILMVSPNNPGRQAALLPFDRWRNWSVRDHDGLETQAFWVSI